MLAYHIPLYCDIGFMHGFGTAGCLYFVDIPGIVNADVKPRLFAAVFRHGHSAAIDQISMSVWTHVVH
jgi:hypothetical protein